MTEHSFHHDDPPDSKRWRTLTDEQRYALIDQLFISHPRLLPRFEELERAACRSREPEVSVPCGLALFGEQGVGKTAVARRWMEIDRGQQGAHPEEARVPSLYASLPVHPRYKGLLAGWLSAFNDPCWNGGTQWNMEGRRRPFIKARRFQLLLIDNLELLVHQETERILYTFLDLLKQLISSTEISAVFIGRPEAAGTLLRGSSRLKSFIEAVHFLQPFGWDRRRPATVREFCFLLRAIDLALPYAPAPQPSAASCSEKPSTSGTPRWRAVRKSTHFPRRASRSPSRVLREGG